MSNDWETAMKRDSDGAAWWWCHGGVSRCGLGFEFHHWRIENDWQNDWEELSVGFGGTTVWLRRTVGWVWWNGEKRERSEKACRNDCKRREREGFYVKEKGNGFTWKRKGTVDKRRNDCKRREREGFYVKEKGNGGYADLFFSKSFLNGFKQFNIIWTQKLSLHPPF